MKDLTDKIAVVTGGASGIGLALCERFVSERMKVVVADIDEVRLEEVGELLSTGGAEVATRRCDTSSQSDVNDLAQFTMDKFGGAHVLCNNAGIGDAGNAWTGPMELWERAVGVNLYGVVHGVRAFLPIMSAQGEGHIVNTASMAGLLPVPGHAPYNVTKHGIVALSEGLYLELKGTASPIEVSVLCPGWVKTRIMDSDPDNEFGKAAVASGMAPAEVADQVWNAIINNQFWILTHAEMRELPVKRMRRAADQKNPPVA